jgi:hypothetical protein
METKEGKIVFDIDDREAYKKTYPILTGKSDTEALHELHVFLLPVNPEQKDVDLAIEITNKYNEAYAAELGGYTMKMCYLTLLFRTAGQVKVLQSARYFRSNDQDKIIAEIYKDSAFFQKAGFDVARIKIEANAYSNKGVPSTDDESKEHPKYFEHHIKVEHKTSKDNSPLPKEEEEQLVKVSQELSKKYKAPVPLSWNNLANPGNHDNPGYQRFLNIRFRNVGLKTIQSYMDNVTKSINEGTNFKVVKSIDEYVWYDTYTKMDWGWIDFSPEDEKELCQ